ncbi:hypothetical protein [Sulfuriferula sp.]|uniref:hypothetical protein n=1 Tax=Sulfuriferula sp. TaxID=2025307 RepID=UPI00272F0DB7|nr:hypothetical protein [Sulfuriferula sp.]MDP2026190.1 hypothetical protein [Sulfuriferula sp.]
MNGYVERLNAAGLAEFHKWLVGDDFSSPPMRLLTDPAFSEEIGHSYVIDVGRSFATSYALGKYLHEEVFSELSDTERIFGDTGMWAWLSLAFIGSLVSKKAGKKPVGSPLAANHYMQANNTVGQRQNYRLITRTAWWMVRIHGSCAAIALSSPDSPWGEVAEQTIGRQHIASHRGFFTLAGRLYLAPDGALKKGAAGKRSKEAKHNPRAKGGLGAMRRLALTLNQFGRTYNTRVISPEKMLGLLPKEYERWIA